MATATQPATSGLVPYRLNVDQYRKMIEAGILPEGAHVELLGGLLVKQMTKYDPHDFAVSILGDLLRGLPIAGFFVREEKSIVLSRVDRPEPDLVLVRGDRRTLRRAPRPGEIVLIVEVAESSYAYDRGAKWRRYAAACIVIYWIVNLLKRQVEVYTDPDGRGKAAAYDACTIYGEGDAVPVVIDGRECGRIAVRDLLI